MCSMRLNVDPTTLTDISRREKDIKGQQKKTSSYVGVIIEDESRVFFVSAGWSDRGRSVDGSLSNESGEGGAGLVYASIF